MNGRVPSFLLAGFLAFSLVIIDAPRSVCFGSQGAFLQKFQIGSRSEILEVLDADAVHAIIAIELLKLHGVKAKLKPQIILHMPVFPHNDNYDSSTRKSCMQSIKAPIRVATRHPNKKTSTLQ